jgi:hypothetical protein
VGAAAGGYAGDKFFYSTRTVARTSLGEYLKISNLIEPYEVSLTFYGVVSTGGRKSAFWFRSLGDYATFNFNQTTNGPNRRFEL